MMGFMFGFEFCKSCRGPDFAAADAVAEHDCDEQAAVPSRLGGGDGHVRIGNAPVGFPGAFRGWRRGLRGELDAGIDVQGDGLALEHQTRGLEAAGAGDLEQFAALAGRRLVQVECDDELVAVDVAGADDLAEVVDDLLGHGFGVLMLRLGRSRRHTTAEMGRVQR